MTEDTPQRAYSLREVFNGLRWLLRTGASWRMMPLDLPLVGVLILDSCTLQSTPESGGRAGYAGRSVGAVGPLANKQDHDQVQKVTGDHVNLFSINQP
jgi:hypothetical protein